MDIRYSTLCRICLEDGATCPIFENAEDDDQNIPSKIFLCTNEKLKDVLGFPRCICQSCNKILDTSFKFIIKFKESNKILENSLLLVKQEDTQNGCSDKEQSEVEIEIDAIKVEPDTFNDSCDDTECLAELVNTSQLQITKLKKEKKPRNSKNTHTYKTNNVASSILEGDFSWNGVKCLGSTIIKRIKPPQEIPVKRKRELKIEIPKVKKPAPPKLCDLCGEVFKNQDKLSMHKKKVHFRNPVKCPKCPRTCASEHYLNRHMKRKHETNKNFVCSACGRSFAFKGELSSHYKNVHNKHLKPKKVFSCKFCNKTYKCAKSIVVHERSVHTGQRPAVCSVCGTSFYHEDYLKEHMRLHTGETPFKCPVCGRGYAQRGNMKSHLRIHRISELDSVTLSKIRPNYLKLLKV